MTLRYVCDAKGCHETSVVHIKAYLNSANMNPDDSKDYCEEHVCQAMIDKHARIKQVPFITNTKGL